MEGSHAHLLHVPGQLGRHRKPHNPRNKTHRQIVDSGLGEVRGPMPLQRNGLIKYPEQLVFPARETWSC